MIITRYLQGDGDEPELRGSEMKILRFPELKQIKGIPWSSVHIRRLEKAERFPGRVNLAEATVGWIEAEVDDWLEQRVKARDGTSKCSP